MSCYSWLRYNSTRLELHTMLFHARIMSFNHVHNRDFKLRYVYISKLLMDRVALEKSHYRDWYFNNWFAKVASHSLISGWVISISFEMRNVCIDRVTWYYFSYWQTYNRWRTKALSLNVRRLVLQLLLSHPLKPVVQSMLQLYLSDQNFIAYWVAAYIRSLTVVKVW